MTILFEIPLSLSRELIVAWLDIVDVARLDSSCSSRRTNRDCRALLSDQATQLRHTDWSLRKTSYYDGPNQKRVIDWLFLRNVHVSNMCLLHPMDLDWAHLHAFLQQKGRDLLELKYIRMPQDDGKEDILEDIIANCTNLEKLTMQALDVEYFTGETPDSGPAFDETLCRLFRACGKLRAVNLGKTEASDEALKGLAAACPGLEQLLVAECIKIGDTGVGEIARSCPSLREVDLSHTVCTDEALVTLSEHCHELRSVTLGLNARYLDVGVTALGTGCPKLESFTCADFTALEAPSIAALARGCRHLQTLHLGKSVRLTDSALCAIAENCTDLRSVELTTCTETIATETLQKLAQSCRFIHTLRLGDLKCVDVSALQHFALHCSLLREVRLTFTPLATDAFITALVQNARQLQSLRTFYCRSLTAACLDAIAEHCPRIRTLKICDTTITIAEMEAFLVKCPQLGRDARKMLFMGCH
jgi:hypothetical protein